MIKLSLIGSGQATANGTRRVQRSACPTSAGPFESRDPGNGETIPAHDPEDNHDLDDPGDRTSAYFTAKTRISGTGHPPQTGVSTIAAVRKVVFPMCPYVAVSIRKNRHSRSRSRIKGYVPEGLGRRQIFAATTAACICRNTRCVFEIAD
jgi:hypothetical protein